MKTEEIFLRFWPKMEFENALFWFSASTNFGLLFHILILKDSEPCRIPRDHHNNCVFRPGQKPFTDPSELAVVNLNYQESLLSYRFSTVNVHFSHHRIRHLRYCLKRAACSICRPHLKLVRMQSERYGVCSQDYESCD